MGVTEVLRERVTGGRQELRCAADARPIRLDAGHPDVLSLGTIINNIH